MSISLPVRGLRPLRGARFATLKLPKPQRNGVAGGEAFGEGFDGGIQSGFGLGLGGQAGLGVNFVNKFSFRHRFILRKG